MSLNDVISSDEFQNRFGVHTKPFQEFAAYILIMAREHTDLSVREVGAYVKNLMQEKHKLELDLAEADPKFSTANVQAALIAGQAEEIKQRETHIAELQARLDREYALSERLKAQVVGLKSEISCLDASNRAVAVHIMRVCCTDRCSNEEREQSKAYLRVAFS